MLKLNRDGGVYEFGDYQLHSHEGILTNAGRIISLPPKALDTLLLLVQNPNRVLLKDEMLAAVWDVNVEENNLAIQVSLLRKTFGDDVDAPLYIETVTRRGYLFIPPVTVLAEDEALRARGAVGRREGFHPEIGGGDDFVELASEAEPAGENAETPAPQSAKKLRAVIVITAVLLIVAVAVTLFLYVRSRRSQAGKPGVVSSLADEAEIKRVLRESQTFEAFQLYENPQTYRPELLKAYWLPTESGGKEIQKIEESINRLKAKGQHYGPDSRLERFDYIYVRVLQPGDVAEAGTMERWYLPLYNNDGSLVVPRNVYFGPYQVDYVLRKVNDVWLIEQSTTPRSDQK